MPSLALSTGGIGLQNTLVFPLASDFGYGFTQDRPVVVHRFGELDAKAEQRFAVGLGPRKFAFRRQHLSKRDRNSLVSFWEGLQGAWQAFTYNVPSPVQVSSPRASAETTTPTLVTWEYAPLSIQYLANACQTGFNFIEVPTSGPTYQVNSTCLRFPSSTLQTALLSQVQQIIPLIHIRVREAAVPDIWLSDRRCTLSDQASGAVKSAMGWPAMSQTYLPRVLGLGEPGSDTIISQDIKGTADNVQFTFGNADRVMTALANDTDLKFASIDLCLLHVNSNTVIQLWKGFIVSYTSDGSPQFTVRCSDGLYQITQMYPVRAISRQCWKMFRDGVNCPYATQGSGGDPNSCDYYFDSVFDPSQGTNPDGTYKCPGGCQAHGMTKYFGGHPAEPQGVVIKDNSTGLWGIGRSTVTATSIISDTIWGNALQEIWCNDDGDPGKAFWVNCMIAAGRDESDYYDALGIVGAGPIGSYTGMLVYTNADGYRYIIAPMLDGQTPQGFQVDGSLNVVKDQPTMGLREVTGNDPCDLTHDSFSLGDGTPQKWGPEMAAGTAFVEVRRTKASGVQPTTTDQHEMKVPISQGLAGWTWDQNGNRTLANGLTNPFWIAVNCFLRTLGLFGAGSASQLANIVLPSLYAGDGSGTAEIADNYVTPIVGTGLEKQFRFQGVLASQKPFRDWLVEVLACGLGYFTFEFGKLKLGCRINASAVEAFTLGNILFQSLRLEPIEAGFEKLVVSFADQAYQYQANTAEYCDKTHAAYYGRAGAPLSAPQHLVGCGTLSQALRLAAVRTREEIGGINATEWRNARNAYWQTTILALNTEVGQVVSMTHPDVPGGAGDFRILSWRLKKDWSIDITAKTVTPSMYDLTTGPKPQDVTPDPLPGMVYAIPLGPMWAPYQIQAPANDALFPGEWTFDCDQTYTTLADGSALASLAITGNLPVNEFSPTGAGGPVIGTISQSTTGGSLPGGATFRIALCAIDSNGLPSTPSRIAIVQTPAGANTNQITLSNITWPSVAGLARYAVFIATQDDLICWQQGDVLTAGTGNTYTPTSITINGPLARSTWALPSPYVSKIRIKAKHLIHGGIVGVNVDNVTASTIVCNELINPNTTFSPVGRIVSVIGRPESSTPFVSFTITGYDKTTGTLTVTPSPTTTGHPELSVQKNDTIVIRFKADAANTSNPTQITDSGCQNMVYADGMTPGAEVGNILRVIAGTGRGQLRKITGNTQTQLSWDLPLTLDTTSVWIVEAPAWDYVADSTAISNADPSHAVTLNVPTDNFVDQPLVIAGFTVDSNGNESPDGDNPIREDWIYGAEGEAQAGFILPVAGVLGIQSDAAPAFYLNNDFTPGAIKAYVKSAPVGADLTFSLYVGTASDPWITLTIPAGQKSVVATSDVIDALAPIPASTNVRLAITSVGTTYPGTDLTVFVYA
ncbi:MAG TPA: hypothetical protein VFA33_05105 [Bryobacteraceae bacterium]|nr:hypothetical protein [Bryobacteraceae bacterium]